jgi:hypothetical protein
MLETAVFNLILTLRLSTLVLFATLCFGAGSETTKDIFPAIRANDLIPKLVTRVRVSSPAPCIQQLAQTRRFKTTSFLR